MSFVSSYLTFNRIGVLPEEVFTTSTSLLYLYVIKVVEFSFYVD